MRTASVPSTVSFANGQSVTDYYKAFTNYMNHQCNFHADKVFTRYYSQGGVKSLTYAQVDLLATNLACKWAPAAKDTQVVSFIGDHSIAYLIIMSAMLKLRITMMAISPRNSEAAAASLLEKTQCKLLVASTKYENLAKAAAAAQVTGDVEVIILDSLDIDELLKEPLNSDHKNLLDYNFSDEDRAKDALIIHSSGSTAFPKPIYLSNRYLFNWFNILFKNNELHINENDAFLTCSPLFHIFGFFSVFSMATVGGTCVFLEKLPPSQEQIDFAVEECNCTAICATPIIFEHMIPYLKVKNDYSNVKRLKLAIYGGAPLKHEAGEWLQVHGLNIRDFYGTTEIGCMLSANLDKLSKNWGSLGPYLKDPSGADYCVFETNDESEPDVKHLYIRGDSPTLATGISNRPDGGYNTNDLFREDPNFPGYYKYLGRRDDTLIMGNGEKTNPLPMEATIRQSPMVKQVAVLGQERQCTAALIEIDMDYAIGFGPEDVISAIHAAVKEANKECPGHSTILPQMVKILPFDQELPSTDKGTVMRKKSEAKYQDIVDKLYKDFIEGPSSRDATNKNTDTSTWTAEETEDFLVTCTAEVLDVLKTTFKDRSQSVFDHGLNSLTSIQLRNRIAEYFDDVAQNFLFQHPSITSMREALFSGHIEDIDEQIEKRYQQAQELAKFYIKEAKEDFAVARNLYDERKAKVVLLTGATGSLGSFMLRDLLKDASVKKIYCVIRGKEEQLMDRLIDAFDSRSIDSSLLKTDRVEVLPMRFNDPFLGFSEQRYYQLKDEVTIVQHCAWLLDFNMPIDHYDKECIAPFYNLLKFAYHEVNPMHVHFISSISASAAYGSQVPEQPLPFDSHICMPMGYAHSKFVIETLFDYLTTEKNFPCYIERLGQVCGDSGNGVWNTSEQYPLMFIGGGSVMHKMPASDTVIDWISVDYAAATIADIILKTAYLPANRDQSIYHIVNPQLIKWSDILEAMKNAAMHFDIVSPAEWVSELEKNETNPAYKLVSFYQVNFKEKIAMPVWETKKTSALTPIISRSPVLDGNLFGKFLARWKSVGFYDPSI